MHTSISHVPHTSQMPLNVVFSFHGSLWSSDPPSKTCHAHLLRSFLVFDWDTHLLIVTFAILWGGRVNQSCWVSWSLIISYLVRVGVPFLVSCYLGRHWKVVAWLILPFHQFTLVFCHTFETWSFFLKPNSKALLPSIFSDSHTNVSCFIVIHWPTSGHPFVNTKWSPEWSHPPLPHLACISHDKLRSKFQTSHLLNCQLCWSLLCSSSTMHRKASFLTKSARPKRGCLAGGFSLESWRILFSRMKILAPCLVVYRIGGMKVTCIYYSVLNSFSSLVTPHHKLAWWKIENTSSWQRKHCHPYFHGLPGSHRGSNDIWNWTLAPLCGDITFLTPSSTFVVPFSLRLMLLLQ